jgi:hypothetical protein
VVNPAQGFKLVRGVLAKRKGFESFPMKTFDINLEKNRRLENEKNFGGIDFVCF